MGDIRNDKVEDNDKTERDGIDLDSRAHYSVSWALLGQWFCVKEDCTLEEQTVTIDRIRTQMLFNGCPDKWIADRFYGGFPCETDPSRVHVYFASGQYSFTAAGRGEFWEVGDASRRDMWKELLEANEGWEKRGPWAEGVEDE